VASVDFVCQFPPLGADRDTSAIDGRRWSSLLDLWRERELRDICDSSCLLPIFAQRRLHPAHTLSGDLGEDKGPALSRYRASLAVIRLGSVSI
jgi:hypothetical protein